MPTPTGLGSGERVNVLRIADYFDPTDDPRMLGRFGGYEIVGVIGFGGMGVVLKGFEPALDRYVAIKVLAPHLATSGAARTRFAREARAAAAVLHENVVAIHRVSEAKGLPYLVMPYLPGDSLQKRLDRAGAAATQRDSPHRDADRRRAGGGPRARTRPPRHQAGKYPAGRRASSGSRSPILAWPGRPTTPA